MIKKDIWSKDTPPAKDVDAFIEASPSETQEKLREMRQIIKSAIPKAEEKISYKMPAYKLNGKWIAGFAGFKNHIGYYPMSGSLLEDFKDEIKDYVSSKGAVQFPLDKPLPVQLIKKLINARIKSEKTR